MTTLLSITVTPNHSPVVAGGTLALTATGTYDDIADADITTDCTWASSATGVATVVEGTGVVTGVAGIGGSLEPARATITATLGDVSASAEVLVTKPRDFYAAVDCQAVTAFAKTSFGLQAGSQALINDAAWAVDYSWDGVTVAGQLTATGGTLAAITYAAHPRSAVWLKRNTGTGGGAGLVKVIATEEG